jgi:chemotaxis protein MotA
LLPSFGLIGTLMGMVLLLKNISGQHVQSLPAALSLAVLTTLYGAVLANVVVAPLAARLHAVAVETETKMRLTTEWVMMLLRGEVAAKIANKWNGTVPPHETEILRDVNWSAALLTHR